MRSLSGTPSGDHRDGSGESGIRSGGAAGCCECLRTSRREADLAHARRADLRCGSDLEGLRHCRVNVDHIDKVVDGGLEAQCHSGFMNDFPGISPDD